ncbi:hypothetical protein RD110_14695 [Rhodoferax koreense]|uniref:ImpA N-terminal domain-containing protein n=1 Tax=Rhodoferax koreensis TaxID=1842727 RepID=A0A1P8JX21_9BURK|nr:type VI secretion system ImpA family N-terminal domain-containing protein [Rhodoferax koreense]APW38285.1 hypothetical protein RD110_14695 [Rhodoferax koreense]
MNTPVPVPISEFEPCGPNLEYDHEFAVLLARMVPRADAQYGSFVGLAEPPNWAEIERDCRRLLLRSHDINLLVWLCRARTRLAQAPGLAQSLGALSQVLHAWPDAVHPQIVLDGEREPAVRANALAALADAEGLLGDVWEIVVAHNTALRLTVRDVERAFAVPPVPQALSPGAVSRQLAALRVAAHGAPPGRDETTIDCLAEAARHVSDIDAWAKAQLGDDAPSLVPLSRALRPFVDQAQAAPAPPVVAVAPVIAPGSPAFSKSPAGGPATQGRTEVLASIRGARHWFERHEPSSPVAVLLKQAERLVGKRFSQVAGCIPPELLQQWDAETEDGTGGDHG